MLKKLSAVMVIAVLIKMFSPDLVPVFVGGEGEYSFYLGAKGSDCQIVTVLASEASQKIKDLKNICGESLCFSTLEKGKSYIENFLITKQAAKLFSENINGIVSSYYYSPKISNYTIIKGKKVNIHTALSGERVVIGTPIIFGSY